MRIHVEWEEVLKREWERERELKEELEAHRMYAISKYREILKTQRVFCWDNGNIARFVHIFKSIFILFAIHDCWLSLCVCVCLRFTFGFITIRMATKWKKREKCDYNAKYLCQWFYTDLFNRLKTNSCVFARFYCMWMLLLLLSSSQFHTYSK